mgnify:CR=1 FL=1
MTQNVDRETVVSRLLAADDILILCHKNPDGDTIGSGTALCLALQQLGKNAAVLCSDPIPAMYDYMPITVFDGSFRPAFVVAVDVAGIQLFGERNNIQEYAEHVNLCIDHHGSNSGYAYETLVDAGAAASAELLTTLIPEMGAKITIDSSTLVNKGFEVIEAHWLFGTPAERISVLLHPQSIIHSMVEFEDGAIKAQLGTPDMRLPISFALLYPDRANRPGERFNFLNHPQLTFAEVDRAKYPALDIAYDCLRRGGTAACTMNGANEVAVAAFLARKCAWLDIVRAIEHALNRASFAAAPTLADYAAADGEARALAAEFLQLKN